MKFLEQIQRLERVHYLIKRKATGTPQELARRLDVSLRTVHEVIRAMKELGGPIYYCQERRSYCYEYLVEFSCSLGFEGDHIKKIVGGENVFLWMQDFCIEEAYHCNNNVGNRSFAS